MTTEQTTRYRKRPVVIDAFQWTGDFDALDAWFHSMGYLEDGHAGIYEDHNPAGEGLLVIPTLEGEMRALRGDYIIRGVKGEFYPCKPDIFTATYEPEKEYIVSPSPPLCLCGVLTGGARSPHSQCPIHSKDRL
jgi:hypothetical protein